MKTILIADCNGSFCIDISEYLRSHGGDIEVLTAGTAEEAIGLLTANAVDLLIADLNLRLTDGPELIAFVKSNYPGLPIYATMEFMDMKTFRKLAALGIADYIIKPYDIRDLVGNIVYMVNDGMRRKEADQGTKTYGAVYAMKRGR